MIVSLINLLLASHQREPWLRGGPGGSPRAQDAIGATPYRIKLRLVATLLVCLVGLCGCVHEYLMKLSDGGRIISLSRPKLQGTNYLFTDQMGQGGVIPRSHVVKIQAVSLVKEENKPSPPAKPNKPRHWYFLWLA
jgi:hypothetical protein